MKQPGFAERDIYKDPSHVTVLNMIPQNLWFRLISPITSY